MGVESTDMDIVKFKFGGNKQFFWSLRRQQSYPGIMSEPTVVTHDRSASRPVQLIRIPGGSSIRLEPDVPLLRGLPRPEEGY